MAPPRALNYTLTDKRIAAAKSATKPYSLKDAGGLFVEILPGGSKVWRYSYRIDGKRTKVTLGRYPSLDIKTARDTHERLRREVAGGLNPARQKQIEKVQRLATQANTFQAFADVWIKEKMASATERTRKQALGWLKNDVFPKIGNLALTDVQPRDVLGVLEPLRNTPTKANNIRSIVDRIFRYAAQKLLVTSNPALPMQGLIDKPAAKHYRHLNPAEITAFVEGVRTCRAHLGTKLAVEFLMLTSVRKDNVCKARWEHIDRKEKTWTIPGRTEGANGNMKAERPHTVYLSRQALHLLEQAEQLSGKSPWVFPSVQNVSRPMTEVTLNHLFSRLRASGDIPPDFKPHGLRSTASTMLNEHLVADDIVEMVLAHKEKNNVRGSYNHAMYAEFTSKALQWYADAIDNLVAGRPVVSPPAVLSKQAILELLHAISKREPEQV